MGCCRVVWSAGVGGVAVGGVVAVGAGVVVCGVVVSVGTCVEPWIRRRVARCFSSIAFSLGRMTRRLSTWVIGVVVCGIGLPLVVVLAVRCVLMAGRLTCGDVGHSRSSARVNTTTNRGEEWTRGWG